MNDFFYELNLAIVSLTLAVLWIISFVKVVNGDFKVPKVAEKLRNLRKLLCLALIFWIVAGNIAVAYADEIPITYDLTDVKSNYVLRFTSTMSTTTLSSNSSVPTGGSVFYLANNNTTLTFSVANFLKLDSADQSEVVTAICDTDIFQKCLTGNNLSSFINDLDAYATDSSLILSVMYSNTKVDYGTAYKIFRPWSSPLGVVLAMGVIVIISCIVLLTVFDIMYLAIDWFRDKKDAETASDGKKHWVSQDARRAVKIVDKSENGGGTGKLLAVYGLSRIWMWIALGICILYLVDGELFKIVPKLLKLVQGVR